MLQDKAPVPLSVGELPVNTPGPADESGVITEDGREPVELLARIFAHIGHRIPGFRKIEKRFEGTDNRSGIASDFFALLGQLYSRNEQTVTNIAENMAKEALSREPKIRNASDETVTPHWGDETATHSGG